MGAAVLRPLVEREEAEPESGIRRTRSERSVLLVAQDEAVLASMGEALAQRQFEVSAESSFELALAFVARSPGSFDAIVTAFEPSSSQSIQFAERLRQADPSAGIVLWSPKDPIPSARCADAAVSSPSMAALADVLTVLIDAP